MFSIAAALADSALQSAPQLFNAQPQASMAGTAAPYLQLPSSQPYTPSLMHMATQANTAPQAGGYGNALIAALRRSPQLSATAPSSDLSYIQSAGAPMTMRSGSTFRPYQGPAAFNPTNFAEQGFRRATQADIDAWSNKGKPERGSLMGVFESLMTQAAAQPSNPNSYDYA